MATVENVLAPPPNMLSPEMRKHWRLVVVVVVFFGSVVAFMDDGGVGNIDTLIGQYGVSRVRLSSMALNKATGYNFGTTESDIYNDEDEWGPAPVFDILSEDEVNEGSRNISRLPRTTKKPYNYFVTDMSKRYFLYSPSGGWSNQRM
ncbi:Hypothetical Protein FCC1311_074162 [Hondaea fermentalgiana]|uniref:Uncharacterized protein n=1 Tax=Hondaea fermentalgiana TaxID=2315210 RepID=A0A2R5GKN8_9STRA|nr:Hypothetical Protein FCC1311_074162 [Hondaea fermentalgiana]|eukprot:GBG31195.1 Hypothetical Protein FCC1311_074162 [Hondaea fermentalgiana]